MALIFFNGDKGGTGKSTVCRSFVNYCLSQEIPVHVLDTDRTNPDVFRFCEGTDVSAECLNLRNEDGWAALVDACIDMRDKCNIAVNLPAGNSTQEGSGYNKVFFEAIKSIEIPVVTFWIINRGIDSVNLIRHQLDGGMMDDMTHIVCLRNQYFGGNKSFTWDESKTRKLFEERGGKTGDFPVVSDRVTDILDKNDALPFYAIQENLLGTWDKLNLQQWLKQVKELFDELALPLVRTK